MQRYEQEITISSYKGQVGIFAFIYAPSKDYKLTPKHNEA